MTRYRSLLRQAPRNQNAWRPLNLTENCSCFNFSPLVSDSSPLCSLSIAELSLRMSQKQENAQYQNGRRRDFAPNLLVPHHRIIALPRDHCHPEFGKLNPQFGKLERALWQTPPGIWQTGGEAPRETLELNLPRGGWALKRIRSDPLRAS